MLAARIDAAAIDIDLLLAGDPWSLYEGRTREHLAAAAARAQRVISGARSARPARVIDAAAAETAVVELRRAMAEVHGARGRLPGLLEALDAVGRQAAQQLAAWAAEGWRVDQLTPLLDEVDAAASRARAAAADPLVAADRAAAAVGLARRAADLALELPFLADRHAEWRRAVAGGLADRSAACSALPAAVERLRDRWAAEALADLDRLVVDANRSLVLAATLVEASDRAASAQAWDDAERSRSAVDKALAELDRLLARPTEVEASLAGVVAEARRRADAVRSLLEWNRTVLPAGSAVDRLSAVEARLARAVAGLDERGADPAALAGEVAAVAAVVEEIDRDRLEREGRELAASGYDGGWWGDDGSEAQPRWPRR